MYWFRCPSLPKPIYLLLTGIVDAENMTQRAVVVAGVMAIHRLRGLDPAQAADVLTEARKLCPRDDAAAPA